MEIIQLTSWSYFFTLCYNFFYVLEVSNRVSVSADTQNHMTMTESRAKKTDWDIPINLPQESKNIFFKIVLVYYFFYLQ